MGLFSKGVNIALRDVLGVLIAWKAGIQFHVDTDGNFRCKQPSNSSCIVTVLSGLML